MLQDNLVRCCRTSPHGEGGKAVIHSAESTSTRQRPRALAFKEWPVWPPQAAARLLEQRLKRTEYKLATRYLYVRSQRLESDPPPPHTHDIGLWTTCTAPTPPTAHSTIFNITEYFSCYRTEKVLY